MKATNAEKADVPREQRLEHLLMRFLRQMAERPLYALEAACVLRADRQEVAEVYERAATDSLITYPELRDGQRPELTGKGRALLAASL